MAYKRQCGVIPERGRHPRGEQLKNDRSECNKPTYNIMATSGYLYMLRLLNPNHDLMV